MEMPPIWFFVPVLTFLVLQMGIGLVSYLYEPKDRDAIEERRLKFFGITTFFTSCTFFLTVVGISEVLLNYFFSYSWTNVQSTVVALGCVGWLWGAFIVYRELNKLASKLLNANP